MGFIKHAVSLGILLLSIQLTVVADDQPTALSTEQLDTLLTTLETNLSGLKTLRAEFKQSKHISLFDDTLTAKGRLLFQAPGNIRFELTEPFESALIVAGDKVAKYERTGETWKKLKLKNTDAISLVMKQIGDWMTGKFKKQSRIFALSAVERDGRTVMILKSKPERFAKLIKQIEIDVSDDRSHFKSIIIRETGGDHTVLSFLSDDRSQTFPAGTFDVSRPTPVELPTAETP